MIHSVYISQVQEAKILVWEINESAAELQSLLTNFDAYSVEYKEIKLEKRRLEFLAARIALNTLLGREVKIIYNDDGKPFLSDNSQNISISHSGNRVAVMAHPEIQVGIDIEKRSERFLTLYKRYLSENEQIELNKGKDALIRLQLAWSAKEAMYKVFGDEVLDFTKDIRILDFNFCNNNGFIYAEHIKQQKNYLLQYVSDEKYNLVWID
ncbi:MAG: 4'-phosphopantetheinyl transferase superfamily protein [Paludibacter sp.]|jgi:phosphopantetheinyl transferase|nr:4'-phosphopantetheinyl transferase superfamily protein [Paludibacter sp.]